MAVTVCEREKRKRVGEREEDREGKRECVLVYVYEYAYMYVSVCIYMCMCLCWLHHSQEPCSGQKSRSVDDVTTQPVKDGDSSGKTSTPVPSTARDSSSEEEDKRLVCVCVCVCHVSILLPVMMMVAVQRPGRGINSMSLTSKDIGIVHQYLPNIEVYVHFLFLCISSLPPPPCRNHLGHQSI